MSGAIATHEDRPAGVGLAPREGAAGLASGLLAAVAVGIVAVLGAILLVAHPRYSVYVLVGDDAGYYFNVARNFCLGHGWSFDRIHPTNGFNPLFALILIPAFRVFAPDLSLLGCYRVGVLITYLAMVAGLFLFARLIARWLEPGVGAGARRLAVAACMVFYAGFLVPKGYYGMDAGLVLALGLAILLRIQGPGLLAPGWRPALADGALLGLIVLSRVDTLPLLVAVAALSALAGRTPADRLALLRRLGVAALVVAPCFVAGTLIFGTWMPVSARLKTSFPHVDLAASLDVIRNTSLNAADLLAFAAAWGVAVVASLAMAAGLLRGRGVSVQGRDGVLGVLSLYLAARLTYMGLFSRMDVQGSYAMLAHVYLVLVALSAAEWIARRASRRREALVAATAALLVLAGLGALAAKGQKLRSWYAGLIPGGRGDEMALGAAIHARTGPTDVLYGGSFGLLGFFSDRPWINGDGVANSYEYQRAFVEGGLDAFLVANRVTHVVFLGRDTRPEGPIALGAESVLYDRSGVYHADPEALLRWTSLRGGGAEIVLARYVPPGGTP